MAEQPIKHNDIIEVDKTIQGIKNIIKELKILQKTMRDTAKGMITFQKNQNINTPGGKQATRATANEIEQLVAKNKKLTVSIRNLTKEQVRLTEERRKARLALKQEVQAETTASGSLDNMRAKLNQMTSAYNKATPTIRNKMAPAVNKLTQDISKAEKAVGKHQRNVGNYPKAFQLAGKAVATFAAGIAGATAIIQGMVRGIKNSISTILNFDQAMADVQAITRASDIQIGMLRDAAKSLGGVTKFTASEVAGLQKELGKLGFTVSEILSGTGGILALAAATGEDLARSAEVAGNAIRAFGLDASESRRVADVMARAFTGSALNLERFSVSMRSVAPVAKAFGFTIEETTALLGSLANAGFDASMSGTATRNILLNLADTSGALAQKLGGSVDSFDELIPALIKLREEGADLNTTLELTDKRSVAAFNRFLEGAEFTRAFKDELVLAAGAAEEMAEIQLNTLKGDLTILKSAFQGLIIEVSDTNTAMNDAARGGVALVTKGLVKLKDETAEADSWFDKLRKNVIRIISPTGLPALIDLLKLGKGSMTEFGDATKETAKQTNILTWAQQQQMDLEEKKKVAEEAEIERKKELLELEEQRSLQAIDDSQKMLDKFAFETKQVEDSVNAEILGEKRKEDAADKKAVEAIEREKKFQLFKFRFEQRALKDTGEAKKESAKTGQKISLGNSIVSLAEGVANTVKAGFPINIPLLIGYFSQVAGIIATIKAVKFEHGGHGELGGERHSRGGTHIPGIGEAERGEYFGIINRQMTSKYKSDLPAIFDSLNSGRFHDVWSNANIQLQTKIDPYTKKMYDQMMKTPTVYTDSHGDTVLNYPDGYTRVIKRL